MIDSKFVNDAIEAGRVAADLRYKEMYDQIVDRRLIPAELMPSIPHKRDDYQGVFGAGDVDVVFQVVSNSEFRNLTGVFVRLNLENGEWKVASYSVLLGGGNLHPVRSFEDGVFMASEVFRVMGNAPRIETAGGRIQ
jgi:hypothetical protein